MTTEERMAIICNKAKKDADEATRKANEMLAKRDKLKGQVCDLENRIYNMMMLANACIDNKVEIPGSGYQWSSHHDAAKKYGYDADFLAEGIRHHTGFICKLAERGKRHFKYIGIKNGGYCGKWDFYTDGREVFSIHEENGSYAEPRICDMEQFLKEFPVFEQAFYNWIESLA